MQLQEAIKEGLYNFYHSEYAKVISTLVTIFAIFILLFRDGFRFVISTLKNWKKAPLIGCFFFFDFWHADTKPHTLVCQSAPRGYAPLG